MLSLTILLKYRIRAIELICGYKAINWYKFPWSFFLPILVILESRVS